ncbi:LpxI family protein [Marinicauda sp. Alg238-R41]|uniref:LpxI family protein n=1 Tax=Marinicauda sp. Alg238-R41 TaxID=2993447 RepID=UPI0022E961B9|nr:UDP-2,3-diacylglucosamine diphosphatase LpxI [Marinicauda sp. Alg238-R41]
MMWHRLGLIAGGGGLPKAIAKACSQDERLGCVIALQGFADPADFPGATVRTIAQFGHAISDLREAGCDAVCLAGVVKRPDFSALKPDWAGVKLLPRVLSAATRGDDALLRTIVGAFEEAGFTVVGAQELTGGLLAVEGPLGRLALSEADREDALKALEIAAATGSLDIGQGAVVCGGLVLAVEAQEGTDEMLARVATLPSNIRGQAGARRGVLAKRPKPTQELRVDLPVIGVSTVIGAAQAGLAGIAVIEGGALIINPDDVARAADEAGLFVVVLPSDEVETP